MSGSIRAGFGFETQPRRVTSSRVARLFYFTGMLTSDLKIYHDYEDQRSDERWKAIRSYVIMSALCKCDKCGSDKHLDAVHIHLFSTRKIWDYSEVMFEVLCVKCRFSNLPDHDDPFEKKWLMDSLRIDRVLNHLS
jgi:hypothetical protein